MRSPVGPEAGGGQALAHQRRRPARGPTGRARSRPRIAAWVPPRPGPGQVAQRHRRRAARDRDALAVAERREDPAFLGGDQGRRAVDHGRVDEGGGGHRRDHVALRVEARRDRDRADGADPLRLLLVDDQRRRVGGRRRVVDGEDLGEALQGAAGDDVGGPDPAVGDAAGRRRGRRRRAPRSSARARSRRRAGRGGRAASPRSRSC